MVPVPTPVGGELGDATERDKDENIELELERRGFFLRQLKILDDVDDDEFDEEPALPGVGHSAAITPPCSDEELIGCLLQLLLPSNGC